MRLTVLALSLSLLLAGVGVYAAPAAEGPAGAASTKWFPGHYLQLGWSHGTERWAAIAGNPHFAGGQRVYLWKHLEPEMGKYDFSRIDADLAYLRGNGKRLVIEVWDTFFSGSGTAVPDYLLNDPRYAGGVVYRGKPGAEKRSGSVAKRYLPQVTDRYLLLVAELGKRYDADPNVAAFVHTETAIAAGPGGEDFDAAAYDVQMRRWVAESRKAFPTTPVLLYGNWYPYRGTAGLKDLGRYAVSQGVGWGGPDVCPGQRIWGYEVIRENAGKMAMGVAVQWQSYDGRWTAEQLFDFAVGDLKLSFVFWLDCERRNTGGLSFRKDVLPLVERRLGEVVTDRPANLADPK